MFALFFAALFLNAAIPARANSRPNILFILADDLSWSDIGCYGNPWFETPHLDRLASQGARFTQAYSAAPICSASRASILTGKTPAQLGFEFVTKPDPGFQTVNAPLRAPRFTLNLPLEETTIAEALGEAAYETAFFGKWHLNQHYQRYLGWSPTHGPKAQGFSVAGEDFGSHPYSYWNQKEKRTFLDLKKGEFVKDGLTERAIRFLKQDHEKPFFLMVSHFYVHDPIHTRVKWLHDHYFEKIPADHPRREILAHYGAMVTSLDHYVGQLLDALDKAGLADSTYVTFTSDNGGHPNYAGNAPLRGSKWNLYEGGIRVPMLVRWRGKVIADSIVDEPVSGVELFSTFQSLAETGKRPALSGDDHYWHFPYYHPEKKFESAPAEIGIDDGVTSQTRPHSAIRRGNWKLVQFYENLNVELYDLTTDPYEQSDLSGTNAEKTAELRDALNEHLEKAGARLPTKNPDYKEP
ncbi:sulfatase [Verrucomicrobiales bacterium BCK34]|nr:sulfatase [Verrucomicrobiales bacterium BCK34]